MVQVRHRSPSVLEITGMYVVRLHPDVNSFTLEPRSLYAGLMLFVSLTNNAFACNWSNFTFDSCRVSPPAIQQQQSGNRFQALKYGIHVLSSTSPVFDLNKFHAVKRGRSIDLTTRRVGPYLGSDDLRDPDSERSNQLVAACASHAPSVKRSCFS